MLKFFKFKCGGRAVGTYRLEDKTYRITKACRRTKFVVLSSIIDVIYFRLGRLSAASANGGLSNDVLRYTAEGSVRQVKYGRLAAQLSSVT